MANGEHIEVAKAYVTIVPSMEGSQATITKELTGVTQEASEQAGSSGGAAFGEKFAAGIKGATAVIGAAMAAATAAAVATGRAFIESANNVASYGDTVAKESAKMHISTTAYQELDFILQHYGSSIDVVKTGMKTLTTQAEANSDAFSRLGISEQEVANLSQEDLFYRVVEGLQNCTDESERTVLAQQLLGRSSVEMTNLFNASAEETEALRQQVHDLGGVMSEEAVRDAEAYQDAMLNMETSLDSLKRNMMSDFLPGITSVMDGLSKVFSGNGGVEEIQDGLQQIISNITAVAPQLFELAGVLLNSLLEGFAPMVPSLVSSLFSFLNGALVTITGMIPQLLPVIQTGLRGIMSAVMQCLPIILQSLITLVNDLVVWISQGNNVTMFVNSIVQLVSLIAGQLSEVLPVLIPALVTIISELATALTTPENIDILIQAVLTIAAALFQTCVELVPVLIQFAIDTLKNLGELLGNFFVAAVPIVVNGITKIVEKVKSWGNSIKTFITTLITNIKTTLTNWINNVKNAFINGFNNIKNGVSNIITAVKNLVERIITKIKELPEKVVSIGKNLVKGLWNGITDKVDWVVERIKSMGSRITNAIKDVFGIASPSKVFAEIGNFLALGLGEGFEDGMSEVQSDMVSDMDGLTGNMTATINAVANPNASTLSTTNTYNGGNISINVYGAQGQNVNDLANAVAYKLEEMTRRRGVIYG